MPTRTGFLPRRAAVRRARVPAVLGALHARLRRANRGALARGSYSPPQLHVPGVPTAAARLPALVRQRLPVQSRGSHYNWSKS